MSGEMADWRRFRLFAVTALVVAAGCITPPPPAGPETPASAATTAPAAKSGAPPARTSDERRAVLDKQLDDSIGAFDARLHKEQQQIAEERDARQATVAATTVSAGTETPSAGTATTETPAPTRATGNARTGDLQSDKVTGVSAGATGNGAPANVVPDGNDDDIIARRLRKAAEQETDPELKDKLWKEYVEYKKNTRVR